MAQGTAPTGLLEPKSTLGGSIVESFPAQLDQTALDSVIGAAGSGLRWTWLYTQYATASIGNATDAAGRGMSAAAIDPAPAKDQDQPLLPKNADDLLSGSADNGSKPITTSGDFGSLPNPVGATQEVVTFASGLTFNNTFEASVSNAFKANILTAEQTVANTWTGNVTLNFDFNAQAAGTNNFLATNNFFITGVTYAQLKTALQATSGGSAVALSAFNSLPAADPAGGVTYFLPVGYANFLGLSASTSTDTTTLNTSYNWNFGQDVVNTMIHEITEGGMGRIGGLGVGLGGRWSTMDLFSYNAAGQRDLSSTDTARVFSFNGGLTTSQSAGLTFFSANSGNDAADFQQLDIFGTGSPGETNSLTQTDINIMLALGWAPAPCFCPRHADPHRNR